MSERVLLENWTYDQIYITLLEMGVIDIDKYLREPSNKLKKDK